MEPSTTPVLLREHIDEIVSSEANGCTRDEVLDALLTLIDRERASERRRLCTDAALYDRACRETMTEIKAELLNRFTVTLSR